MLTKIEWRFVTSRFLAVLGSIFVTLLLLEGLVRLVLPQRVLPSYSQSVWMPDERYGWRRRPLLDLRIDFGEGEFRLITDEHGNRIGASKQPQYEYHILALGDSFVAALQLDYEKTLTSLLEEQLSRALGAPVAVVNTAVSGWDPNHYLLKAKEELSRREYDLVMVFLFMGNDVVDKRVSAFPPIGFAEPVEFDLPDSLDAAEVYRSVFYPISDYLEKHSHLYVLYREKSDFLYVRLGLKPIYLYQTMQRSFASAPNWQITGEIAADIGSEAKAHDVPALFVLLPVNYQVEDQQVWDYLAAAGVEPDTVDLNQPRRLLTAELEKHGLAVVDVTPSLRDAFNSRQIRSFGSVDAHFSEEGHQIVADFLEPTVTAILAKK